MRSTLAYLCLAVIALAVGGCGQGEGGGKINGPKKLTIAVIPKGTTHAFWKSVETGARQAGQEFDATIIWKGPLQESDLTRQQSIVEDFVAQGVDGIVLAPLSQAGLAGNVANATAGGAAVVIIDSKVDGTAGRDFVSYIATDNYRAGQLGARKLAELIGEHGKAVLLRYASGHGSTGEREQGFLDGIAEFPGVEVIVDNKRGGATTTEAQQAAENILDKLREADGIFCVNESTTHGMLNALRANGLAGKKKFVGFDASETLVAGLKDGHIDALVIQNPTKMGYLGVKAIVMHRKGKPVEPEVDTGVALVTMANLDDPEIKSMMGAP